LQTQVGTLIARPAADVAEWECEGRNITRRARSVNGQNEKRRKAHAFRRFTVIQTVGY